MFAAATFFAFDQYFDRLDVGNDQEAEVDGEICCYTNIKRISHVVLGASSHIFVINVTEADDMI